MRPDLRRALHALSPVVVLTGRWLPWHQVQALLVALALVAVMLEIVRLRVPAVHALLARLPVWRAHEAARPSGAMWLAVGFAVAARAPMPAALGGILAAAWADPAASLVGRRFGRGEDKSVAGSVAALAVTAGVTMLMGYPPAVALVAGLSGAACERWAVSPDDNLWVAPGVTFALVAFA